MKKRAILATIALLGLTLALVLASLVGWRDDLLTLAAATFTMAVVALAASLLLGQRQILERTETILAALDAIRGAVRHDEAAISREVRAVVRAEADGLLWSMDSRLLGMLEAESAVSGDGGDGAD